VGDRLGRIDKDLTALLVGLADVLTNWINCSENIGHVRHSDELDSS
jgi:hypothetical protein